MSSRVRLKRRLGNAAARRLARGPEIDGSAPRNGGRLSQRLLERRTHLQLEFGARLPVRVTVRDGDLSYGFRCSSTEEYRRATTLFSKEPGTVRWISSVLRAGDIFYDIGANMGIYTIPAAYRVGAAGRVYAFEPHVINASSLLRNVAGNGLQDRVTVLSCALHDRSGFFDFSYRSWAAGTSMSQLEGDLDPYGNPLEPVGCELKVAATVDDLLARGMIEPATAIKIDVDGNELLILQGMKGLLMGEHPPRSVQVEANPDEHQAVHAYMEACGFTEAERNLTAAGEDALREGHDPLRLPYNVIFRPLSSTERGSQ